ncbi:MAG: substrate-binding domain-containing protein [Candidatus Caldarchaeum sp.]|nr:substrate-binding domain-containing protein [Candidatus Caldarchaeum sp.]
MGKISSLVIFALAAALTLLVVGASLVLVPSPRKTVLVYSAPTLAGVSDELVKLADMNVDVQVHGSVFAANLIKAGRRPDLFLSVDVELKKSLAYRAEKTIGTYGLVFVCRQGFNGLDALVTSRIGLADPNQAPIGYRALAAMYLISEREKLGLKEELERSLNIRYIVDGSSLKIVVSNISPSGRFYMRPNLDIVASLLEAGAVDCIFAHTPFVITRNLGKNYKVFELPEYARFDKTPSVEIVVELATDEIKVVKLEAIAVSFSEDGDRLLRLLDRIDVGKYGFVRGVN